MAIIPLLLAAGSVTATGREKAYIRVQRDAALKIGTELVRFVKAEHGDRVYYLAARAADLNIEGITLRFPLAVALPGHKRFAGPGMYVAHATNGQWVGVMAFLDERNKAQFTVETMQGDEAELLEEARARELTVHRVGEDVEQGDFWEGAEDLVRIETRSTVRKAILACALATLVFGGLTVAATVLRATLEPVVAQRQEDARTAVEHAIATVDQSGLRSLPKPIEDLDRLVAIADKELGRVKLFRSEGGKTEFEFEVPLSANYESWKSLGPLVTRLSDDGMWRTVATPAAGGPRANRRAP